MIKKYRQQIDIIDSEILALLNKRKSLIEKAEEIKLQQNIPLKDQEREEEILKKAGKFKNVFIEVLK